MNTNPTAPTVSIQLDRERNFKLDLNALATFEMVTGKSILTPGSWASIDASAGDLRALVWAALRHEDSKLTIETVGGLISFMNLRYVKDRLSKLLESIVEAAAEGDDGAALPLPESSASTGSPSGVLVDSTLDSPNVSSGG